MFNDHRLKLFLSTAIERHRIYIKKMDGEPRPWTEDPIFHKYRFCNVFRQYDKCTIWMIKNLINKAKSFEELWPAVIVFRYISSMNIYRLLGERCTDLFNMDEVHKELVQIRKEGVKFNGCFLRNPKVKGGWAPIHDVPFMLVKEIQKDGHLPLVTGHQRFEDLTKHLIQFSATSGFMAHQYCCDLEYSKWFTPTDKYTYATMGPGSRQGMNILLNVPRHERMKQEVWLGHAQDLHVHMDLIFRGIFSEENISMQDVQNWLCEFQKYSKYLAMEKGKARVKVRKYP